jgi:hypothetical protein
MNCQKTKNLIVEFNELFSVLLTPEQHKKIVIVADKAGYRVENWVASILEKAVAFEAHS